MKLLHLFIFSLFISCGQENQPEKNNLLVAPVQEIEESLLDESGKTIETRFKTPTNFERVNQSEDSFGYYLRNLPLKPHGVKVKLYDGRIKADRGVYNAVVDMEIGKKDLHQCADAVMRFRAEYLWNQKRYEDIHFNFTNGFRVDYSNWMQGKRLNISGNSISWINKKAPSNTYADFWAYMEMIFNYAGTLSLSQELEAVTISDMKIGDVFIRGGSPGHAVLVVDMAEKIETGEKIFLLAQSYMPAQETQVLKNPNNDYSSLWYSLKEITLNLITPEWTFDSDELKRFGE